MQAVLRTYFQSPWTFSFLITNSLSLFVGYRLDLMKLYSGLYFSACIPVRLILPHAFRNC